MMIFASLDPSPFGWWAWLFWIAVAASVGGMFILVGLLMEKYAGKQPSFTRKAESIEHWGEWAVIAGVFVEILSTGAFAVRGEIEYRQSLPENLPIRSIVADVNLVLKGTNALNMLNNWHSSFGISRGWWLDSLPKKSNLLIFVGKTNQAIMLLKSDDLDWMRVPSFPNKPEKEIVSLNFDWSGANAQSYALTHADEIMAERHIDITTNAREVLRLVEGKMSMSDFDREIKCIKLLGAMVGVNGSNALSGSCDMTFNGSLNRRFSFKSNALDFIIFVPETANSP